VPFCEEVGELRVRQQGLPHGPGGFHRGCSQVPLCSLLAAMACSSAGVPIVGWAIGLVMNAWDVYWRHEISEADIRREMERQDS
jgi:hypothetical protein